MPPTATDADHHGVDELSVLHPSGLFLRREALAFGYRDRDLAAALAARVLVRVRHGAYVAAPTWSNASADAAGAP